MIGGPAFSAKNAVPAGAHPVPDPSIQGWHRPLLCGEAAPVCHLPGDSSAWLAGFGAAFPSLGTWGPVAVWPSPVSCRELAVQPCVTAVLRPWALVAPGHRSESRFLPALDTCGGTASAQVWPCRRGSRCFANPSAAAGSGGLVGVLVAGVAGCLPALPGIAAQRWGCLNQVSLSGDSLLLWISCGFLFLRRGFANRVPVSLIVQRTTPEDTLTALQGSCNCRVSVGLDE